MADKNDWIKLEGGSNSESVVWDYKKEPEIQGIYTSMDQMVGPNNSNMYHLKTKEGDISLWGSTLIDDRFKGIGLGEEVKIVYLGKQKSEKTGRSYNNFDFYHRPVVTK